MLSQAFIGQSRPPALPVRTMEADGVTTALLFPMLCSEVRGGGHTSKLEAPQGPLSNRRALLFLATYQKLTSVPDPFGGMLSRGEQTA